MRIDQARKDSQRIKQMERYRQDRERRKRFVLRTLKTTKASMVDIAKRAGYSRAGYVKWLNNNRGIRDPVLAKQIGAETISKKRLRPKINFFSDEQKTALINENLGLILKMVRPFWGYPLIKQEYGNFNDFLRDIQTDIFRYLDYYNPKKLGKNGKPKKVSSWIGGGAEFFCRIKLSELNKKRLRQIPIDEEGREMEGKPKVKSVESRKASGWEIARISGSVKSLSKNLGLDINDVAKIGYEEFKDFVAKMALDPSIGLTEQEKFVILGRLDAKKLKSIGKEFAGKYGRSITRERARQLQRNAIAKIKRNWKPQ